MLNLNLAGWSTQVGARQYKPQKAAIIAQTFFGQPHLTQRTWLDLGDISYRQGPGYFHVAAEAYRGALQRAGDVFRPDLQVRFEATCCTTVAFTMLLFRFDREMEQIPRRF